MPRLCIPESIKTHFPILPRNSRKLSVIPAHAGTQRKQSTPIPLKHPSPTTIGAKRSGASYPILQSSPFRFSPPSFPRTREPREKQIHRLPSPSQSEGDAERSEGDAERSERRGCPGQTGCRVAPVYGGNVQRTKGACPKHPCDILPIRIAPTMIPLIANHADQLAEICRRHHVKRLEVFGSAANA